MDLPKCGKIPAADLIAKKNLGPVGGGRLKQEVIMVVHQAEGMDGRIVPLGGDIAWRLFLS